VYEANLAFLVLSRARGTAEGLARAAIRYCEGRPMTLKQTLGPQLRHRVCIQEVEKGHERSRRLRHLKDLMP
jgi:hypothetical protein